MERQKVKKGGAEVERVKKTGGMLTESPIERTKALEDNFRVFDARSMLKVLINHFTLSLEWALSNVISL